MSHDNTFYESFSGCFVSFIVILLLFRGIFDTFLLIFVSLCVSCESFVSFFGCFVSFLSFYVLSEIVLVSLWLLSIHFIVILFFSGVIVCLFWSFFVYLQPFCVSCGSFVSFYGSL